MKQIGIVLGLKKHTDTHSLLYVLTRESGRQCVMVFGSKWRTLLLPMSVIEMETDARKPSVQALKEATLSYVPSDSCIEKTCIRLFLAEVLLQTLTHPMTDEPLFDFIHKMVILLDQTQEPENVHILFLLGLADLLGVGIDYDLEENRAYADLLSGQKITRTERQTILRRLCQYFEEHIEGFQMPKSLDVLTTIFDR